MIQAVVSDFSRVLLFPKDQDYTGSLNALHRELQTKPDYNPLDHFSLNQPLLNFYRSLTKPVFILTSDSIQDAPEFQPFLKPVIRTIFSAKKMKTDKKESQAYVLVVEQLHLLPSEVLYIDDSEENIAAARQAGLTTVLYRDFQETAEQISAYL